MGDEAFKRDWLLVMRQQLRLKTILHRSLTMDDGTN